jgi:DNA processing protein
MAHQGALDANGPTIAITATGIDRVYPAKHRELAHRIVEDGAIVTEFPIGTQPKSENFPRRNRIISGISHGTLVVEAALRSGSLITARLAMEQNREVFAIPGSIHNPLAKGCHQLIRQGAKLVETGQDILEEMATVIDMEKINSNKIETPLEKVPTATDDIPQDKDHQHLLDKMGFDPVPVDQLVISTGFSPESISAMLLILELQGQVSANGGGTYTRLK